jgi:putative lipoic acid-binding regulatory protein
MRDVENIQPERAGQGFQFPGTFTITAMGNAEAGLDRRVPEILAGLGRVVHADTLKTRPSGKGNYIAVTVDFDCPQREDYDAAHTALRADPDIRYTL